MSWHIEPLDQMTRDIEGVRTHIIKKEKARMLEEYLRFSHLFRKRYGFELQWLHIKKLLKKMPSVYRKLKDDLNKALEGNRE